MLSVTRHRDLNQIYDRRKVTDVCIPLIHAAYLSDISASNVHKSRGRPTAITVIGRKENKNPGRV